MIDRFLCLPDDIANISYDVQADFLEGEKMSFASAAIREREGETWLEFAELMLQEQKRGNKMNVSGFDL